MTLGEVCAAKGNFKEAEEYYKKAIEVDGNYAGAYEELGRLYREQGREEEAERLESKVGGKKEEEEGLAETFSH